MCGGTVAGLAVHCERLADHLRRDCTFGAIRIDVAGGRIWMSRLVRLVTAAAVVALGLTACGDDSPRSSEDAVGLAETR
jgi:hypothetical protein